MTIKHPKNAVRRARAAIVAGATGLAVAGLGAAILSAHDAPAHAASHTQPGSPVAPWTGDLVEAMVAADYEAIASLLDEPDDRWSAERAESTFSSLKTSVIDQIPGTTLGQSFDSSGFGGTFCRVHFFEDDRPVNLSYAEIVLTRIEDGWRFQGIQIASNPMSTALGDILTDCPRYGGWTDRSRLADDVLAGHPGWADKAARDFVAGDIEPMVETLVAAVPTGEVGAPLVTQIESLPSIFGPFFEANPLRGLGPARALALPDGVMCRIYTFAGSGSTIGYLGLAAKRHEGEWKLQSFNTKIGSRNDIIADAAQFCPEGYGTIPIMLEEDG